MLTNKYNYKRVEIDSKALWILVSYQQKVCEIGPFYLYKNSKIFTHHNLDRVL
jgi:hypothetical protein